MFYKTRILNRQCRMGSANEAINKESKNKCL